MVGRLVTKQILELDVKSDAVVRLVRVAVVVVVVAVVAVVVIAVIAVIAVVAGCLGILSSSCGRWDPKFISSVEA